MVKLILTDDNKKQIEMEGGAVIAFVIDPAGKDADSAAMLCGRTNVYKITIAAGTGIGTLIAQLEDDPLNRAILALQAKEAIKSALFGEVDVSEVVNEQK